MALFLTNIQLPGCSAEVALVAVRVHLRMTD